MYIKPYKNPNSVFDIHSDFQNLKRIREEENTKAFYDAVNELMEKYGDHNFSMDDILPEKAMFDALVFNLQENVRAVTLLSRRGCKAETYECNLRNIQAICTELRNLKWKWKWYESDEDDDS